MHIREALSSDLDDMLELFPRLASFELPNNRNPRHLWQGDARLLVSWADGKTSNILVNVAKDDSGRLLGMTMVSMREELLSHNASAHLEVIVIADNAQGMGVGRELLRAAEEGAMKRGALSMSLHVFAANQRARRMYVGAGYDEELLRCIKPFTDDALT